MKRLLKKYRISGKLFRRDDGCCGTKERKPLGDELIGAPVQKPGAHEKDTLIPVTKTSVLNVDQADNQTNAH